MADQDEDRHGLTTLSGALGASLARLGEARVHKHKSAKDRNALVSFPIKGQIIDAQANDCVWHRFRVCAPFLLPPLTPAAALPCPNC